MSDMFEDSPGAFVFACIAVVGLVVAGGWAIRSCSTVDKATFEAADHELDRRNFERSQSYREGLRRDFDELILSYSRAKSDDERATILAVLRHRVEGAPPEAVPEDVRSFLAQHSK